MPHILLCLPLNTFLAPTQTSHCEIQQNSAGCKNIPCSCQCPYFIKHRMLSPSAKQLRHDLPHGWLLILLEPVERTSLFGHCLLLSRSRQGSRADDHCSGQWSVLFSSSFSGWHWEISGLSLTVDGFLGGKGRAPLGSFSFFSQGGEVSWQQSAWLFWSAHDFMFSFGP